MHTLYSQTKDIKALEPEGKLSRLVEYLVNTMEGDASVIDNSLRQYRQSIILGLVLAVRDLFPGEDLKVAHSILDGVYCELQGSLLSVREVKMIEQKLGEWIKADRPIVCKPSSDGYFTCDLDGFEVKSLFPALERSGTLTHCRLVHYPPGFILLYADYDRPDSCPLYVPPAKLSATFSESQRWVENLRLSQVRDVNAIIKANRSEELITLAEALHEKKISLIADRILEQRRHVRVILISGPSSSGKTTFAQRLSTQLRVNGLRPVALSLDDYFVPREETPKDSSGHYDFEALEALDLPLLDAHIQTLIKGGMVETPIYDFVAGHRRPQGKMMHLDANEILVIEGIHGLNPRLLPSLERDQLFKIYISALFQLNLDSYNRIPTTEVRLIRRMTRDVKYRGITPDKTLGQWWSVRRGENTNIFPFQEEADVMFNSSLLYELNALRPFTEPLLQSVPPDSPNYEAASYLLRLLSFFEPLDSAKVPFNSILREFLGGGIYN